MLLVGSAAGRAAKPVRIFVNGVEVQADVPARWVAGRILVPVRWLAEALGAKVSWEERADAYVVRIDGKVSRTPASPKEEDLEARLRALEPPQPRTVVTDWQRQQVQRFVQGRRLHAVEEIRSRGRRVPFQITSQDDTWMRPVYAEAWHTTFMGGKYSSVQHRVADAQRNTFVYTGGLSEGAGLYYGLGFTEDWKKPVGSSFRPSETFELWLVHRKVRAIYRLGDEWLVVVEPRLSGYQTVKVTYRDAGLRGTEEGRLMLFRVVTPEGYELERVAATLPVR